MGKTPAVLKHGQTALDMAAHTVQLWYAGVCASGTDHTPHVVRNYVFVCVCVCVCVYVRVYVCTCVHVLACVYLYIIIFNSYFPQPS